MEQQMSYGIIYNNYTNSQLQLQQECLIIVNQFFQILEIHFKWLDFYQFIDTYRRDNKDKNHQFQKHNDCIIFKKDGDTYTFYKATNSPQLSSLNNKTFYDNRLYALARVCYGYITYYLHKMYQISNKPDNLTLQKEDYLEMCQNFMIALQSDRIYSKKKDVIWLQWRCYWSTQTKVSVCYSNCPGSCRETCKGGTCFYYFPENEKDNQLLPVSEKLDQSNIFDDKLFWLASIYHEFLKEYKY